MIEGVKRQILQNIGPLVGLSKKKRAILASGAQSVVLIESHKEVLLVTKWSSASNIERLHGLDLKGQPFVKPKIVGLDVDLAKLISPKAPKEAKKLAKEMAEVDRKLWTNNVVYLLPRYDGTLQDLPTIRFKDAQITALESTLTAALTFLHQQKLTHNDIALKNIFYKGENPHLQFFLGDFGSLSKNPKGTHERKCAEDFARVRRVISQAKKILEDKEKTRIKLSSALLPSFAAYMIERLAISPLKPQKAPRNARLPAKRLFRPF